MDKKVCPKCGSKNVSIDMKLIGARDFCKKCGFYGPQGFEFPNKKIKKTD